jgi:hypothetical protein
MVEVTASALAANHPPLRRLAVSAVLLPLAISLGCGSKGPFTYRKTTGTVTYEDGQPIAPEVTLRFTSLAESPDGKSFPRPATAHADAQGNFAAVTSYKYGDGLIPGKHKVVLEVGPGPNGKPLVPPDYANVAKTPLIVDSSTTDHLEIKVPRPK